MNHNSGSFLIARYTYIDTHTLLLTSAFPVQAELKALQGQGMEELVYAYVSCMAVKSDHRRKGIASALLRAAEIQV